ncbi:MAG: hypothetical protein NTZ73_04305 [Candidatus Diapherotrites archaeon]|nr:hypothetical protein [Candidatus Diapherotrites archaeon]
MFKKSLALLLLLMIASGAFAIRLIEPESKVLEGNDLVGKVYPGGTLELIFSKENNKYSAVELKTKLPEGFTTKVVEEIESLKLFIYVPKSEVNWKNLIKLEFSEKDSGVKETAEVYFLVENGLLAASMNGFSKTVDVGSSAEYEFVLVNKSSADAFFSVSSTLSNDWFAGTYFFVPKNSSKVEKLSIVPKVQGKKQFEFIVGYSNKASKFKTTLDAVPTLASKFKSVIYGLPFYSFSMVSSYMLNGLLALFF